MHRGARGLIVGGVLVVMGGVLARTAWAFSATYDQTVTMGNRVVRSKVMLNDQRARIESTMEGMEQVVIKNDSGVYSYLPKTGIAMKLPSLDASQAVLEHPDDYLGYLNEHNATRVGSETVNGYACDVYTFTDPTSRAGTKAWVWKEQRFPVKLEQQTPQGLMVVELTNIQIGTNIPTSSFELPAGVHAAEMNPAALDISKMMDALKAKAGSAQDSSNQQ